MAPGLALNEILELLLNLTIPTFLIQYIHYTKIMSVGEKSIFTDSGLNRLVLNCLPYRKAEYPIVVLNIFLFQIVS